MSVAIDTDTTGGVDKEQFDDDFEGDEETAPLYPRTFWASCNIWC